MSPENIARLEKVKAEIEAQTGEKVNLIILDDISIDKEFHICGMRSGKNLLMKYFGEYFTEMLKESSKELDLIYSNKDKHPVTKERLDGE